MIPTLECQKCGHKWLPRVNGLPQVCPRCKQYGWQREEKNGAPQLLAVDAPNYHTAVSSNGGDPNVAV